jgi:hypothetical protein
MSPLAYLVIALALFASGAAGGIKWHAGQDAIAENARIEKVREQERANRAAERAQSTTVIGAINASKKREAAARSDSLGARSELDRLRGAIAIAPRSAASASCPSPERADPARELLLQCGKALTDLAEVADRLDSDRRTLMDAWPK